MRILILGAYGMAGHMMAHYFSRQEGCEIAAFCRQSNISAPRLIHNGRVRLWLGSSSTIPLEDLLSENFDVVINCLGILVRRSETHPDEALLVNSYVPRALERLTANTKTKIVHLSTDCVFSGKWTKKLDEIYEYAEPEDLTDFSLTPRYAENALRDGSSWYAKTKALGEINNTKDLTIRTSIIGPELKPDGSGLFHWFMTQPEPSVKGYTNVYWTGLTTLQLARTVKQLLDVGATGLCQPVPQLKITKFRLLEHLKAHFRADVKIEQSFDGSEWNDKSLSDTRKLIPPPPLYGRMVKELRDWMKENRNLYPHYTY